MKRKLILIIIIACFTALSFGQRRTRTTIQRIIQLTKPDTSGKMPFEEALSKLQNVFRFTGEPVDRTVISQLVWAGLGNRQTPDTTQVASPQPGQSFFPTQVHVVTGEGVFYYQPVNNSLEQNVDGDIRVALAAATPVPDAVARAGCVVIVTSSATRSSSRSTSNSNRNAMLLEAGHIAQNIQLQTICLDKGLGSCVISEFDTNAIRKASGLPRELDVLYLICVGYMTDQDNPNSSLAAQAKRVAVIVPSQGFEEVEFFGTLNTLSSAGIRADIVSDRIGPIAGGRFEAMTSVDQVRVDNYDGIIIIGGNGAWALINNPFVLNIVNEAFKNRKIIGATSLGTSVLANAGILRGGVKVTGPIAESGNIQQMGAVFTNLPVEKDMRVITCAGPNSVGLFATAFADAILGK